jgi:exoribonuclease-2
MITIDPPVLAVRARAHRAVLAGQQPPYSTAELGALAEHCTAQEGAAQTVGRRMHKSEAALLLEPHVGRQADANVTDSSESGLELRIFAPPAEGRLESSLRRLEVRLQARVKLV